MYLTGFKMSRQDDKWTLTITVWGLIALLFIFPPELAGVYILIVGCVIVYWLFRDILW